MKRFLWQIFFLLILCVAAAFAASLTTTPGVATAADGTKIDLSSFRDALHPAGNLSAAMASPLTAGKSVVISGIANCSDLTIPKDRFLEIIPGGGINNSGQLTLKGQVGAGPYRIFYGSGKVSGLRKSLPQWWGALADGAHDDTLAMRAAIASGDDASVVLELTKGTYHVTGSIPLPKIDVKVVGYEAVVTKRNGGEIFYQANRGRLFEMDGVSFVGNAAAFKYDAQDSPLPWHDQQYEYRILNCQFLQDRSTYAIWLRGAREGLIANSRFENNQGIYRAFSVGTDLMNCNFKNTVYGVNEDMGSEGLKIVGGVSLGVGTYVWVHGNTVGTQIVGAMIDYCDKPVVLDSVGDVIISGSYISSRTEAPAIRIQKTGGQQTDNIIIKGNLLIQNTPALRKRQLSDSVIHVDNANNVKITDNIIRGWSNIGIEYSSVSGLEIIGNTIQHNPRYPGRFAIMALADDASVRIHGNKVSSPIKISKTRDIFDNPGFVTENKGKVKLVRGTSSLVVAHGLDMSPYDYDITLTLLSAATGISGWHVTEVTNRAFTIRIDGPARKDIFFGWRAGIKN